MCKVIAIIEAMNLGASQSVSQLVYQEMCKSTQYDGDVT
jgi:hypothetical protein